MGIQHLAIWNIGTIHCESKFSVRQSEKLMRIPEHVSGSVKLFQEVRSRIIHGGAADDEDILRAIDSGFTYLERSNLFRLNQTRYIVPMYQSIPTPSVRSLSATQRRSSLKLSLREALKNHYEFFRQHVLILK
jgi:hypothetical protein